MKKLVNSLFLGLLLLLVQLSVQAQTGSISGVVADSNGAVVPGATVSVKGAAGQEYTVTTAGNGTYTIPAVGNGLYIVTVTAPNFKTSVTQNVKVDVATPATVDVKLEAGNISETVLVVSGGEVLQTQTATVGTTITGRQITETPITSRDALDLVTLLPGTSTTGTSRTSTINGLPKGAIAITIDGVDVQDNLLRSSDGFFTYVRPRVDAIEEVTVTTAVPGAESSGDGAVGISFATRRGTNNYTGGLFWQHRNTDLNAAYWYNNRDGARDSNGKAIRTRNLLNQFGGKFGGPIPFLNFGEGVPTFHSGKDRAFFFVNYEEFRYPESSPLRTRTILNPTAQGGGYTYLASKPNADPLPTGCVTTGAPGATTTPIQCTRNVLTEATATGNPGLPGSTDPTISALLAQIRASTSAGTISPISGDLNRQSFAFITPGGQTRRFFAGRFDVNLTKNHTITNVVNYQKFIAILDFLNNADPAFPGFPNFGSQGSKRWSNSSTLRSTLRSNIVNEARVTFTGGQSSFSPEVTRSSFSNQAGYNLVITGPGITSATIRSSSQIRESPSADITDSATILWGSHSINFGGQYKRVKLLDNSANLVAPQISFGLDGTTNASEATLFNTLFSTSNAGHFPYASSTQVAFAASLYATLTGRVTAYGSNAYLTSDGTYQELGAQFRKVRQDVYGLFAQDSWKVRPNLTINYGLRWQPQQGYTLLTGNYAKLENFAQIYGVSGLGNIYKPGTLTGTVPRAVPVEIGERASPTDNNNFAPSVGVVWSPDFGGGLFKSIFGGNGRSVIRGGYSEAYIREGTILAANILGSNPGGLLGVSRSLANGTVTPGSLLRTAGNPNLTPLAFPSTPAYPITLTINDGANAFDPNLKSGKVRSWSVGYQREIDKNTVVEVRYVGNRGVDMWRQYNLNELNTIENGYGAEYKLAQANYYFNVANGRGATFAYTGAGTSPLPLTLAYINPAASYQPNNTAAYNSTLFANTTLTATLSNLNPNLLSFASLIENSAARRTNALANGLPSNFFYVNPTVPTGGAFLIDNGEKSWYDGGVVELRRRLSQGLRVEASYTYARGFTNAYATSAGNDQVNFGNFSNRNPDLQRVGSQQDVRHAFKVDATYDLPFGRGAQFFSNSNGIVNQLVGGWSILPVIRWQSGSPFLMQNIQLVGMTKKELQKSIGVYKNTVVDGQTVVTFLPQDIVLSTRRAYDINIANANGYGTTFGGAPTGRYIAPNGFGNCVSRYNGECGYANLLLYGPSFFKFDATVSKKFKIDEKRNVEFKVSAFDVLNMPNFRVGNSWTANTVVVAGGGQQFGQLINGAAYQDVSTTNDPGGRIIEFMLRINF
jgi:hypothetical protein